jgi:small subunit ribosomal protein S1
MSNGVNRLMQSNSVPLISNATAEAISEPTFSDWFDEIADFDMPKRGDIREGTVVSAGVGDIRIDIGGKSEGVIESRELDRMSRERRSQFRIGEHLQVYVVNPEDRDGNVVLSLERAEQEMDWLWAKELLDSQEVINGKVVGFNKGGILVQMKSLQGFVPGSQIDRGRRNSIRGSSPEERWQQLVGEAMETKVVEVDRERNRLILSERAAMREVREREKDRLLEELTEGQIRTGTIINLADFGAFVDLGGADGLVHLSELSWKRVTHPREAVKVGDEVQVYVLNVDRERRRIGLSLKRLEPDPWTMIETEYPVGKLVEATISKLAKFGAFARLENSDGIEGLIHISELSYEHVEHPSEILDVGQQVVLRVIRADAERRRLALSLRQVSSDEFIETDWIELPASNAYEEE